MIPGVIFVLTAVTLCAAAVLAVFGITNYAMSASEAIDRDGLYPGTSAPSWTLKDSSGKVYWSPPDKPLQLIVFADHSLKSFTSVVDGLKQLTEEAVGLEIVVLLRHSSRIAEPVLRVLGLKDIPVVTGSPSLYGRYNIRVWPFVIFVDSNGKVRASSMVNHSWQIVRLWRLANIPLSPEPPATSGRFLQRMLHVRA